MKKTLRNVVRKGLGEFVIPTLTVETGVEMAEGLLFGLDANGLAVLADNTKSIHAIGVVDKTSTEGFGEAFKLNGVNVLRKGEYLDVYTHAIVVAEEAIGAVVGAPVYLGVEGKLTLVKPVAGVIQLVGAVANAEKGFVRLAIMGFEAV
ncbi:MAG: hypothetical protein ACRCZ0_01825 [Cetobacterium sp.]